MKKICRKIEDNLLNVGENDIYPTQLIVKTSKLSQIGNLSWVEEDSGNVFYKINVDDKLHVVIDGFIYESVSGYDKVDNNLTIDGVEQCNEKIGLYLYGIKDNTLDLGVILGDGMTLNEKYPNEDVYVLSELYNYSEGSKMMGLKCMTVLRGISDNEILIATGCYRDENIVNLDEEVANYISNLKIK